MVTVEGNITRLQRAVTRHWFTLEDFQLKKLRNTDLENDAMNPTVSGIK